MTLLSKSDFAKAIKRSAGRVTQLIAAKKIHGPALEGDKVNLEVAVQQLGMTLDPSQQLAQSAPILPGAATPSAAPAGATQPSLAQSHGADLIAEKATGARLENELKRRKLAAEIGKYTLAEEARLALGREMGELIQLVDTWMVDSGKALALEHNLDPRDVSLFLRNSWMAARTRAAQIKRAEAAGLPEHVGDTPTMIAAE